MNEPEITRWIDNLENVGATVRARHWENWASPLAVPSEVDLGVSSLTNIILRLQR